MYVGPAGYGDDRACRVRGDVQGGGTDHQVSEPTGAA